MRVVIVYFSRYGNGKKCVDCVEAEMRKKGHEVEVLAANVSDPAKVPQADLYIFSAAAEQFGLNNEMKAYIRGMPELAGRKYALINTHGLKKPRGLPRMTKFCTEKKMVKLAEIDFQIGKDGKAGNGLPADYQARLTQWVAGLG